MGNPRKRKGPIRCEGRFRELREALAEAIEVMANNDPNYRIFTRGELKTLYDLVSTDISRLDVKDPYYHGGIDLLRTDFASIREGEEGLGLVPLITEDVPVKSALTEGYIRQFGPKGKVIDNLLFFAGGSEVHFLSDTNDLKLKRTEGAEGLDKKLGIDMASIVLPVKNGKDEGRTSLVGYKLAAGFGIGPNMFETLVYDTPFHIEVHKRKPTDMPWTPRTTESGVMGIGFWLNKNNDMLVAQVQEMRGEAKLPEGVDLGIAGLAVAEAVARALGFSTITTYAAKEHPQFRMHPDSERQMMGAFVCYFDKSAKRLGFEPISRKDSTNNDTYLGFRKTLSNG